MLPIRRGIVGVGSQIPRSYLSFSKTSQFIRFNSSISETENKKTNNNNNNNDTSIQKKKKKQPDISQLPLNYLGCMADFYIPPKFTKSPILSWPRLIIRRISLFALNTYSIIAYKRELGVPLQFNLWKDKGIESYIRANKSFANACNEGKIKIKQDIINKNLDHVCGIHLIGALLNRSLTFPKDCKLTWELIKIEKDPKIISFNTIPDNNGVAVYVQFIMKLNSKQKITIKDKNDNITQEKESSVEDYLVFSLDPVNQELLLVGKLFESDHIRGLKSDLDMLNTKEMQRFLKLAADIYRADPKDTTQVKQN
ncbi:Inner membrane mitoribosome receptor MBA1, mitochondrial [Candida tropicalis]